jgi:peroxiredoxin
LLSDVRPAGDVGRRWGVWDELWKIEKRATFIVDQGGVVRWTEAGGVCLDTSRALEALTRLARAR